MAQFFHALGRLGREEFDAEGTFCHGRRRVMTVGSGRF
jgi:hypothetical protein